MIHIIWNKTIVYPAHLHVKGVLQKPFVLNVMMDILLMVKHLDYVRNMKHLALLVVINVYQNLYKITPFIIVRALHVQINKHVNHAKWAIFGMNQPVKYVLVIARHVKIVILIV